MIHSNRTANNEVELGVKCSHCHHNVPHGFQVCNHCHQIVSKVNDQEKRSILVNRVVNFFSFSTFCVAIFVTLYNLA